MRLRRPITFLLCLLAGACAQSNSPAVPPSGHPDLGVNASLHGMKVFPPGSLWNIPVDTAAVDEHSEEILTRLGLDKPLHPDFGSDLDGKPFGIPYVVVPESTTRARVTFEYSGESDPGPYPIPSNPVIEGDGIGDAHLIVISQESHQLFELFGVATKQPPWRAGSGAIFDLHNGTERPAGWTSADAAGLPIFPGLVRYDEVHEAQAIDHALRFTIQHSRKAYLPPASHWASAATDPLLPPMGMRVRLKRDVDVSGFPTEARVILVALKRYGMIVADNGGDFFLSGTADARWRDGELNSLKRITIRDFEVVRMTGIVTP